MLDQGELFEIKSPCINVCKWNNRGYCIGCFRSRYERFNWLKFSEFQRQNVINLCARRKHKVRNNKLKKQLQSEWETIQLDLFQSEHTVGEKNQVIHIDTNIQPPLF